jgi:hypothetical protein
MKPTILALSIAASLAVPAVVHAHALLLDPPPRSDTDNNKTGPCDTTPVAAPPTTTYTAGSTITVTFGETIDHPGYYRLAFSPGGDMGFDANVIADMIPDDVNANSPALKMRTQQITLPATPCEGCTLQLIQCMNEGGACSNYYSCANIRLVAADGDAGPIDGDAGPGGADAGPGGGSDAGNGVDDGVGEPPGLGCSSSRGAGGLAGALLVALAIALSRRRALARRR